MADNAKWYVLHTYSGYENAVKAAIEKSVTNRGLEDMIHKMEIPMETVTEVTESGVMKEVERKVFPGYVLIKITEGPLASFTGTVEEIEPEKNKVRVVVSMFGRETPVELELDQVEVLP